MPDVRPFRGLLYDPTVAGPLETLVTAPYDNISPADQQRLYRANLFNVIRLILGTEEPSDGASANKYTRAAQDLRSWRQQGVLKMTSSPAMYPYEQRFHLGGAWRTVRGVIAEVELESWGGSIIPHERTMPGPIEDRLRLLRAVRANLSPVYSVFADASNELAGFLDRAMSDAADRQVTDESGTRHRVWVTGERVDVVTDALRDRRLMIADGHHRYAVALAYREEMRAQRGSGPWDSMMMLVVDGVTQDPPVLPIHRVITDHDPDSRDGQAGSAPGLGERVRDLAEILATVRDEDLTYGRVALEDGEVVHRIGTLAGEPPTVCALHAHILDRVPTTRMRFVPDAVAAEQAVLSGEAFAAYLLPPTNVERVWKVVEAGQKLPQKSTYFWPKPRTGLVIRPLDVEG